MRVAIIATSLLAAVFAAQIPEFLLQYQQRIGGASDELTRIVRHFDEDSRRSGYERTEALHLMKQNPERLIRDQSQRMNENISRLATLNKQQELFNKGIRTASLFEFAVNYDEPLARKTYENFTPALQFSFSGVSFALIGFVLVVGLLSLFTFIVGLGSKALRNR
ncbi:DUF2937 family protein [Rhodopseudomonas sp. BR0M22]|uniref:DUF2937 family protein n=1 Tax=Rhodopseudomonas sp. BR0M22 TaxID=2269369 RepID=UPI0013E0E349|nr:DUF2937 family protein [Rhodopseudomonas sp. BR0M22]